MFSLLRKISLAVSIPAGTATAEPWHTEQSKDYYQTTGDHMTYCRDFDGQAFIYTEKTGCHDPADFYRGSYYKIQAAGSTPATASS
mmetsp:Transcript_44176/g.139375  ORF Transcript_44176/g.139375 Transcript_44176/m.139375 type:complete len:86 (-) Transcript_44176:188-445(-)